MNYTITYKTFFLLALSIWPFHCDGDESKKKNEIKTEIDSFQHKAVFREFHSDNRIIAYVERYGSNKNMKNPKNDLETGFRNRYIETKEVQYALKRCEQIIYESLPKESLKQILTTSIGTDPLTVFININKSGQIDMARIQLSLKKNSYLSAKDIYMITKNLVEQVSFKRPTDFHIDYISLFISLRTQNALKWLKRDGSNIILKTDTCHNKTIVWEQGSYNHTKAYMNGYEVILKDTNKLTRDTEDLYKQEFLRCKYNIDGIKRIERTIYNCLGQEKMQKIISLEQKMVLLKIYIGVNKNGNTPTMIFDIPPTIIQLLTCEDIYNITTSITNKNLFKKPSAFGLDYIYFPILLRRKDVLMWLKN